MLNTVSFIQTINQMLYIDPAATSVLLSSLTAIVIAVGASVIIIWRRVKKKVSQTLHLDPNAGKEVEDDLVINDEELNAEIATADVSKTDDKNAVTKE